MDAYQVDLSEGYTISSALEFFLEQAIPVQKLYDKALNAYFGVGKEVQETRETMNDLATAVRAIAATTEDLSSLKAVQQTGHILREHRDMVQKLESLQREQVELWLDVSFPPPLLPNLKSQIPNPTPAPREEPAQLRNPKFFWGVDPISPPCGDNEAFFSPGFFFS